jgi:3-methyl-2-oxobutanoate hydroxymethyltransferase
VSNDQQPIYGGAATAPAPRTRVTPPALIAMKARGERIVMITAYDHPSARIADEAGVDVVLVGDSAAMVVLGHSSTVGVGVPEMLMLTAAARRGVTSALLVGDLPFGSYEVSDEQAVATSIRFVKEAGADAVKLEGGGTSVARAAAIVAAGIPVMGHVGLTPQTATALGGYRAQGRTADQGRRLVAEARALADVGCFAIVAEAVPPPVAEMIVAAVDVPVIGIGAGAGTDGQVLVWHDLLGIGDGRLPRFVRRFAEVRPVMAAGVRDYAAAVRDGSFPGPEHTYRMAAGEDTRLGNA